MRPELVRLQYMPGHREAVVNHHDQAGGSSNGTRRHNKSKRFKHHHLHKEKNWNAFIYHNELYFSQVGVPATTCL